MKLMHLAIAAVSVVSFTALAQGKAAPPMPAKDAKAMPAAAAPMPMPQLPAEGKKWIEGMLGNWKSTDVTMTMGDQTMKMKMDMKCEKASGGWATLCRGKSEATKEMPSQEITFLMGWNIGEGVATMFEMTNMGEVHHHTGKWTDDKSITVTHTGKTWEGKEEKDALTYTWNSPKELMMKAEGTTGATVNWTFTAMMKK